MGQTHNRYGAHPVDVASAKIRWLPVAATQTLTKGDFVILSSGLVAIALADSAELVGAIAQDCASLATSTLVPVYADPDTEFEVVADADSSAMVAGDAPGIVGTTGAMMLNVADSNATDVLHAIRSNPQDAASSAYARWIVKINKHAFADTSS